MPPSLHELLTEQPNPASARIDELPTLEILRIINAEDRRVADSIAPQLPQIAQAIDAIVNAFHSGGRLFYIGAGTSGRLGVLDASECPPTFNVPSDLVQGIIAGGEAALSRATETSEDDPILGARDLHARGFRPQDILCGIAASGRTPYVLGAIDAANSLGAVTIGLSCTPDSELSRRAKIAITHVRGNLMVNVQPKNAKLLDRSLRIIAAATGASPEQAAEALKTAGNNVRAAIEQVIADNKKSPHG